MENYIQREEDRKVMTALFLLTIIFFLVAAYFSVQIVNLRNALDEHLSKQDDILFEMRTLVSKLKDNQK